MMGTGVVVMVLGLIFLVAIIALVVWTLLRLLPDRRERASGGSQREDPAEDILRQRLAKGEMDAEEYERSLEVLRGERDRTRSRDR